MSLDKQKILNELGSVVNQLQSADCGCMSRLFNDRTSPNQCGDGYACQGGHCSWGHNPCAGEPHMASCVAHCNPPKLIADTYNYYDQNVVKPAMEEVYNELKSITPENTVVNHPLASQMGASPQGMVNARDPSKQGGGMPNRGGGMENQSFAIGIQGNGQIMNGLQDDPSSGMGEQSQAMYGMMPGQHPATFEQHPAIPAMSGNHLGYGAGLSSGQGQLMGGMSRHNQGHIMSGMMTGQRQGMGEIRPGQVQAMGGMVGQNSGQTMRATHGGMMAGHGQTMDGKIRQMQGQPMASMKGGQGPGINPSHGMNSIIGSHGQNNMGGITGNQGQTMIRQNPGVEGMSGISSPQVAQMKQRSVGDHAAALQKFNEAFPGVVSGDLAFNPMEMAIKMNPENIKQQAMMVNNLQTMSQAPMVNQQHSPQIMNQELYNQQYPANVKQQYMPTAINQQYNPNQQQPMMTQQQMPMSMVSHQIPQQQINQQFQQQIPTPMTQQMPLTMSQQPIPPAINQQEIIQNMSQQQMAPTMHQQQIIQHQLNQQQIHEHQQSPQQINQQINPQLNQQMIQPQMHPTMNQQQMPSAIGQQEVLANSEVLSTTGATYANTQPSENISSQQQLQQSQVMEPIMPVEPETGFNTLGQPVEMIPGNLYRRYDTDPPKPIIGGGYGYSNVKNTISKTSIMGHNLKGSYRAPSRSQLQHLYNQYKGSQSYTQQNVQDPKYAGTASDGKLDVMRSSPKHQNNIPLERLGGDTAINNQIKGDNQVNNLQPSKVEQVLGEKPTKLPEQNNPEIKKAEAKEPTSTLSKKCRNGLQDMVYTSYSLGASWTFHGSIPPRVYRTMLK